MAKRATRKSSSRKGSAGSLGRRIWTGVRRGLKVLAIVVLLVIAVPLVLVPLYAVGVVNPISTHMLGAQLQGQIVIKEWVAIDKMAPALVQSVLMSEDGQFCSHGGVDWPALNAVIEDAIEGETTRGASTITMQLAKNLFLWQGRNYIRKGLEVPLALYINFWTSKRRQMEIYLNIVEWGPGIYGAEAAALFHFKKTAAELSRVEAARLAVTLPNPILRNPRNPSNGLLRLSRLNYKRANQSGAYIKCVL